VGLGDQPHFFTCFHGIIALRSPDGLRRLSHFAAGKLLFSLPRGICGWMFRGEQAFCPLCGSELRGFLKLHRRYHRYCPVCASLQRQCFV